MTAATALAATSTNLTQFIGWRFVARARDAGRVRDCDRLRARRVADVPCRPRDGGVRQWHGDRRFLRARARGARGVQLRLAQRRSLRSLWRILSPPRSCAFLLPGETRKASARSRRSRSIHRQADCEPAADWHQRRGILRVVHAGGDVLVRDISLERRRRTCLSTAALGWLFVVYLFGAGVMPFAGRWIDVRGHRAALASSMAMGSHRRALDARTVAAGDCAGLALVGTGVFVAQATASSYIGAVTHEDRGLAVGLYSTCYYLGGSAGGALPALFWDAGGWPACVALVLIVQVTTVTIALRSWRPTHARAMSLDLSLSLSPSVAKDSEGLRTKVVYAVPSARGGSTGVRICRSSSPSITSISSSRRVTVSSLSRLSLRICARGRRARRSGCA